MTKLSVIRKYAELLGKAAKWKYSKDAIVNISATTSLKTKNERIYEFYCALRILSDLSKKYTIEIANNAHTNVFPKAPGSKKNFPYFLIKNKRSKKVSFQVCLGTDIMGRAGETNAPDISFQKPNSPLTPTFSDVIMLSDAKFKHKLNGKISDTEFAKVHSMILNLGCEKTTTKAKRITFNKLSDLIGNCIISNGVEFNNNVLHHKLFCLKEIVGFTEKAPHKVIG